jgi:hypothetical protein
MLASCESLIRQQGPEDYAEYAVSVGAVSAQRRIRSVTAFDQVASCGGLRSNFGWTVHCQGEQRASHPGRLISLDARVLKQSGYAAAEAA